MANDVCDNMLDVVNHEKCAFWHASPSVWNTISNLKVAHTVSFYY